MKDMIPDRTVTILSGDGGGGKTTLKLQLATAIAGARPWLGYDPDPGRCLSSPRRMAKTKSIACIAAIAKSLDVDLSDLGDSISCHWLARTQSCGACSRAKGGFILPQRLRRLMS